MMGARWLCLLLTGVLSGPSCNPEVVIARGETGGTGGTGGTGAEAGQASGASPAGAAAGEAGQAGEGGAQGGEGGDVQPGEPGHLLADSVADFSLVQGERGWFYGFDTGSWESFTELTRKAVITAYVPPSGDVWDCWVTEEAHWTQVFQLGAHPNGTDSSPPSTSVLERAVRRWVSNYSGEIRISGEIAKIDVTMGGSNGVDALVLVDGLEIYSTFIDGEDGGGLSYEVTARVSLGTKLDFVLDPHEGDDHHDLSRFTAVIERYEQPIGD